MQDGLTTPRLGVGVLTDAIEDIQTVAVATEITNGVLRHLAQQGAPAIADLAPYLPHATHYTRALSARRILWLAVLPASGALALPDNHLALFTLVTRFWKTWRSHVVHASDQIVAEFLQRTGRTPEQVRIRGVPHIRGRRHFVYQVFITEVGAGTAKMVGETAC
jgi:hypothetical protein